MRLVLLPPLLICNLACGAVQSATRAGMMPILRNGIDAFIAEPDLAVAEGALVANMKLIEGVAATYPDETEPALMVAMARATFAFGFVHDELESLRAARPGDTATLDALAERAIANYAVGRTYALRVLMENDDFAAALGGEPIERVDPDKVAAALLELEVEDAAALFWVAFNWGGSLQTKLDPVAATQLPKIERMLERVLALDERVFLDAGPHMLAGALHGFRSPALGGNPDKAASHFDRAAELSGLQLPKVLKAQFVYGQTEKAEEFWSTLEAVVAAPVVANRAALEHLAKRKACRLLAHFDDYFLEDARPVPEACRAVPQKHALRTPSDAS